VTGWLILAGYLLGWVACTRLAVRRLWGDADNPLEAVMLRVLLAMAALFWPLMVIVVAISWRVPKTAEQLRREREALDRRIAELEREAGISGP